jgi:NAD(P)-dependent dehydrogenase (short-subunit alcohol dehydrogenase family)
VTKAFLPLLKESKGRIINVSSVAGLAAAPIMSAYCASKHAVEAFSTATRVELAPFGIKLVTLNPSFHKTPIATNAMATLERAYQGLPAAEREAYGEDYFKACADLTAQFTDGWCVSLFGCLFLCLVVG